VLDIAPALSSLLVVPALISSALISSAVIRAGAGPDADLVRRAEAFEVPVGLLASTLGIAAPALVAWALVAALQCERCRTAA
jgi:hypothetical protein